MVGFFLCFIKSLSTFQKESELKWELGVGSYEMASVALGGWSLDGHVRDVLMAY